MDGTWNGVIVKRGEAVGAVRLVVRVHGKVELSCEVSESFGPDELADLLREYVSVRVAARPTLPASQRPSPSPPRLLRLLG